MRHVMVFFTCSVRGCETRCERLVPVGQQSPNQFVWFDQDELPEGWGSGRLANVKWDEVEDVHATYCPEHAVPVAPQ